MKRSHHIVYFIDILFPGTNVSMTIVLDLPDNVVEGSARAFITVVGKLVKFGVSQLFEKS